MLCVLFICAFLWEKVRTLREKWIVLYKRKNATSVRKRMFESRMGRLTLTEHTAFHVLTPWEHVMFFRLSRRLSSNWFTCQLVSLLTCLFYLKIIQRLFCVIHKRIKSKSSTLVRILKRRGGNCRCKDIPFILVLQDTWKQFTNKRD